MNKVNLKFDSLIGLKPMFRSMSIPSSFSEWLEFERQHREILKLCLVVGGGLLCFLTMAVKKSSVEETIVGGAIRNGKMFHISVTATISLAVPGESLLIPPPPLSINYKY